MSNSSDGIVHHSKDVEERDLRELIIRIASAKSTCLAWGWELKWVHDHIEPHLFHIYLQGPMGLGIRTHIISSNPEGATIDEIEDFLGELRSTISQEVEAHACEVCDNGGVCSFFTSNNIALHRSTGSYEPSVCELIEKIRERDLGASAIQDVVMRVSDWRQSHDVEQVRAALD